MVFSAPAPPAVLVHLPECVEGSALPAILNAKLLNTYLDTGCAPADEISVVKDGVARHPRAYATTAGKLDPARIAMWRERGYSFQIRNVARWYPPLHAMCRAIQEETGFGCYVTAFGTPCGAQGLDYHWDQNIGIVYRSADWSNNSKPPAPTTSDPPPNRPARLGS